MYVCILKCLYLMTEQLLVFNKVEIYLGITTAILFIIQLLYNLACYARPFRTRKKKLQQGSNTNEPQPPVSIIVYAKNESENLRRFLPTLLEQQYPVYEVIVVNDGSTDESDEVLNTIEGKYKHLYHTYIPEDVKYLSRKKLSLTVGIKAAKYDILLFTEANCRPLSNLWVAKMARNFTPGTDIVLGFGAYEKEKGFFNKLVAYDNMINGLQYLSAALCKKTYMGCGKNLAYRKELFFQHKGYYKSLNLHAGDDDLFINQIANKKNTKVELSPESITTMAPYQYFKVWKEMKVSRAATMRYYKGGTLTFYRMAAVTRFLLVLSVIALIVAGCIGNLLLIVAGVLLYLLHYLIQAIVFDRSAKLLQQQSLIFWLPLFDLILPVYSLYVRVYRIFRGKNDYTFRLVSR